jgi:malate dehydrogenase
MALKKILEYPLNAEEKELFAKSADAVRKTNDVLKEIKAL